MLINPAGTPYDLNFRLFGTYIRVHVSFWIFSAILGWNLVRQDDGILLLLIWVACCFISILLHEFGHVWAGKAFGSHGDILLYSFGGLAIGASNLRSRWQRIAVYLAGPAIQLLLYFALDRYDRSLTDEQWKNFPRYLRVTFVILKDINWIWPLFNLLPIFPLDGGQVLREICEAISGRKGLRFALIISIIASVAIAINALMVVNGRNAFIPYVPAGMYTVILFAMLGFESYQLLQQEMSRKPWDGDY